MHVLARVHDESELERITSLMHGKGIPTFVRSATLRRGVAYWVVFVCLNSQAADAIRILKDPSHEPAQPVNVATFERAAYSRNLDVMVKWGAITLIVVATTFAAIMYLVVRQAG